MNVVIYTVAGRTFHRRFQKGLGYQNTYTEFCIPPRTQAKLHYRVPVAVHFAFYLLTCASVANPSHVGHFIQRCCCTRSPLLTRNRQFASVDKFTSIQRSLGSHIGPNSLLGNSQTLGCNGYRRELLARDERVRRNKRQRPPVPNNQVQS